MVDSLNSIGPSPLDPLKKGDYAKPADKKFDGKSFKEIFEEQISAVNDLKLQADAKQEDLAAGRTENVDDVLNAVKKAELAFKTLMEVRNKLVEAYEEINRMRI